MILSGDFARPGVPARRTAELRCTLLVQKPCTRLTFVICSFVSIAREAVQTNEVARSPPAVQNRGLARNRGVREQVKVGSGAEMVGDRAVARETALEFLVRADRGRDHRETLLKRRQRTGHADERRLV